MSWWKISERLKEEQKNDETQNPNGPVLRVRKTRCENCLFTERKLTTNEGRRKILRLCAEKDTFFNCHKATINGEVACCRGFYERNSLATTFMRFAAKNKLVEFVD